MKKTNFTKTFRAIERKAKRINAKHSRETRDGTEICEFIEGALNDYLAKQCAEKVNHLKPCDADTHEGCSCGTAGGGEVDLVILIDSSGSMRSKAAAINDAANAALRAAQEKCGVEARVEWLWVDKVKPGSSSEHDLTSPSSSAPVGNFTQSHQQYLEGNGVTGPFYHDRPDSGPSYPQEQGPDAIADLCEFFDWRPGACRSIFYISDTTFEGERSSATDNDAAKNQAISVANANNVTVFAHLAASVGPTGGMTVADVEADYHELCNATGGSAETNSEPSAALYEELIVRAICECGGGCSEIKIPKMEPCVSVSWGDGDRDELETDDTETLCITLCNCYTNIGFSNVSIGYLWVLDEDGTNVAVLPDGTPSVEAIPHGPICFGDIGPCVENESSCVSREFSLQTRGAKPGKYRLLIGALCYDVVHHFDMEACFELELVLS